MSDILFRAWDKDAGGQYFYFSLEDLNYGRVKMTLSTCIVERYTGLKDKQGRNIYEGDIVECFGPREPAVVGWKDGGFGYRVPYDFVWFGHNHHFKWKDGQSENIEILGNVYENPELVNKPL